MQLPRIKLNPKKHHLGNDLRKTSNCKTNILKDKFKAKVVTFLFRLLRVNITAIKTK